MRQLAPLALHEADVKRDDDERVARDAYAYAPLTRKRAVHDEEAPAPAPAPVPKKRRQKPAAAEQHEEEEAPAEQPEVVEEEAPAAELRVGGGAVDKETGQAFRVVGKTKGWWTVQVPGASESLSRRASSLTPCAPPPEEDNEDDADANAETHAQRPQVLR